MLRRVLRTSVILLLLLGVAAGVALAYSGNLTSRWRDFVIKALEDRGIYADFSGLILHPLEGIVARDVKVFSDADHELMLMAVDRLSLEIDHGRLLDKKIYIKGIEVRQANVSLPLTDDRQSKERLEVKDLSARLLLGDERLEVVRASGLCAGVQLDIRGSLKLKPKGPPKPPNPSANKEAVKRIAALAVHRTEIEKVLDGLAQFKFATAPELRIEVAADLQHLDDTTAQVDLALGPVSFRSYRCESGRLSLNYRKGFLHLRQLKIQDQVGTLDGSATWVPGAETAEFKLNSRCDVLGLAGALVKSDALHEVVFYEQVPPEISIEGRCFVTGEKAKTPLPLELTGSFQSGRLTTRGEMFESLSANFGLTPDGFYIRDALLRHPTGTFAFQLMKHRQQGLRYQAALKMQPKPFLPFIARKELRDLIERFAFHEKSDIFALMEGHAPDGEPRSLVHEGKVQLRSFGYRGEEFQSAHLGLQLAGRVQVLNDITVVRPDGQATGKQVIIDGNFREVILNDIKAECDPIPLLRCFAPPVVTHVTRYRFTPDTLTSVQGRVSTLPGGGASDLEVDFRTPKGSAVYQLWGKDYKIGQPVGKISVKANRLGFDITGKVFQGDLVARGSVQLGSKTPIYEVKVDADSFPYEVIGEDLPFEQLKAEVVSDGRNAPFNISANLLGGRFSLVGDINTASQPSPYKGKLAVDAVSFKRFAGIYSPSNESEGDLTGHFDFTGKLGDWRALKGSGVMIILNGNLYAIPVLGPLTPLLGAFLPSPIRGYNLAKEANCTFTVADGFVVTEDVEALTSTFRIVASGSIDFLNDDLDFIAQARMRGIPGIVLRPVSQLLEYKAEGTFGDPKWKPHLFGLTNEADPRQKPTEKELEAAAAANRPTESPPTAPARRKPFQLFNRNN